MMTAHDQERDVSGTLGQHERVAALLGGPLGWHTVRHEGTVTSTSDVTLELLRGGAPPGLAVVADHQTAGRGRQGRPWDDRSEADRVRSLTVSAALPLPDTSASLVPLAAGLAVADALRRAGASPVLKWPNDVLLPMPGADATTAAKCAGILVERHHLGGAAGEVVIIGIGIDLDWRDLDRDGEEVRWRSVAEVTGRAPDRGEVLADLLRGLAVWVGSVTDSPDRLRVAYRDACVTIGQHVRVDFPDGEQLTGRAVDLEREGRLVIDAGDLGQVAVTAGDVHHVRPA
jgi:BirA family transcriptional regulator, biotin operon repressor / biotin---[acetyl-CoA-carboxylase] ligase